VRVAAIDIGTNTVRMLVRDADETIERDSRITRLGEGVDASGELAEEPMRRTLEAVEEFVGRARDKGAERVLVAGTSALRDARNRSAFADAVRRACDCELEILDGATEGRIAYGGATGWLGDGLYVVCDIGGGSTELITAADAVSTDVGSVRVRERYLPGDPPSGDDVEKARRAITPLFRSARDRLHLDGGEELVGVAGTITTVAALDAGLKAYDSDVVHDYRLSAEGVETWADRLNGMSVDEIKALGPVNPGRADVIGAGALVLACVVSALGAKELVVSERDILDGLAQRAVG
jgi:exopolyphosphatase/guanosine-5'-triphosphate,3'-diphosphate pyrophosphatase